MLQQPCDALACLCNDWMYVNDVMKLNQHREIRQLRVIGKQTKQKQWIFYIPVLLTLNQHVTSFMNTTDRLHMKYST
jgi:hypothetical protein